MIVLGKESFGGVGPMQTPVCRSVLLVLRSRRWRQWPRCMATLFLLACALCAGCGKSDSEKLPSQRPAADSRGETRLWGVTTRIQSAELGPYRLEINNHLATLHAEGVVETFDLQKESWTNDETGNTVNSSSNSKTLARYLPVEVGPNAMGRAYLAVESRESPSRVSRVGTWAMRRLVTVLHDTLCDLADTPSRLACYRAWTARGLAALGGPAGETLYRSSKPRAAMIRLARSTVTPW